MSLKRDVFLFVLENMSTKQVSTIKELRTIDKLCKLIESSEDTIELEDADLIFLNKRIETYESWNPAKEARQQVLDAVSKLNV